MKEITRIFFINISLLTIVGCQNPIEKTQRPEENLSVEQSEFSNDDIEVHVDFINSGKYIKGGPGDEYVDVYNLVASVKNISSDTIFIEAWSCSKEAQFVVDDTLNYAIHSYMMCYCNFPTIETILPDSSYEAPIMVKFDPTSDKTPFRIGFIHKRSDALYSKNLLLELGVKWSNKINPQLDTHNTK